MTFDDCWAAMVEGAPELGDPHGVRHLPNVMIRAMLKQFFTLGKATAYLDLSKGERLEKLGVPLMATPEYKAALDKAVDALIGEMEGGKDAQTPETERDESTEAQG